MSEANFLGEWRWGQVSESGLRTVLGRPGVSLDSAHSTTGQDRRDPQGALSSHFCMCICQRPQLLAAQRAWGDSIPGRGELRIPVQGYPEGWGWGGDGKGWEVSEPSLPLGLLICGWHTADGPEISSEGFYPGFQFVPFNPANACCAPSARECSIWCRKKMSFDSLLFLRPGVRPGTWALF